MKQLIALFLFIITIAVNSQTKNTKHNCSADMTKKVLIEKPFNLDCESLKDKTITHFKIKVPNYKTVSVNGGKLNAEAKVFITKASIGDVIVLFDIKVNSNVKVSPITITIIE